MEEIFQILILMIVAAAWAFALAHMAEMPGKLRLDRSTYFAVQRIYYPGFTIGGACEPISIIALGIMTWSIGSADPAFTPFVVALAATVAAHGIYWTVTHPINKHWMADGELTGAASAFFKAGNETEATGWTRLRDRWEWSHVIRSVFLAIALVSLGFALGR
jgi:hypothetical protein